MHKVTMTALALLAGAAVGCSDSGSGGSDNGNLTIVLDAEDTIPEGLASDPTGEEEEAITDGYSVEFSRYIVSVGLVDAAQVNGGNRQQGSVVTVADYVNLPTTLPTVETFSGIPVGQYSEFGYDTPVIDESVVNVNGVSDEDVQTMIDDDLTYIIAGTLTADQGGSKEFLIEADVPTTYSLCGEEPELGVAVGANTTAALTIHGDHIFFNGFPADESDVTRLANWMWLVEDVDEDGVLTKTDFEQATDLGTLFPAPAYSGLNDGPAGTITSAWDFIRSQLGTQGHLDGEGECEWSDI
jgi:hypothetical protein